MTPPEEGGYAHYPEEEEGHITRERPSESFDDHFSHARLFWNSMSSVEKEHILETFSFHLGSVKSKSIRKQVVDMFANVDKEMATTIADNINVEPPSGIHVTMTKSSAVLSETNKPHDASTQKVAVLIGDGFDGKKVMNALNLLQQYGVFVDVIGEKLGTVTGADGTEIEVGKTFVSTHSALFDSLYVVGSNAENDAKFHQNVEAFVEEAYKHYKPIGVAATGERYFQKSDQHALIGVVFASNNPEFGNEFVEAVAKQRFWNRA